jgi:uncharacterized protein (TIGR02246 family)
MKYIFLSFCSIILFLGGMGQGSVENTGEENRIQNSLNDFVKSWNIHDPKLFSMVFAKDADFTNVKGLTAHGRADIETFHKKPFETMFKNSTLVITQKKVRFFNSGLAAVDAWWEMTGSTGMDGKEVPFRKGLLNLIMIREGDKWLISVMHNLDLPSNL